MGSVYKYVYIYILYLYIHIYVYILYARVSFERLWGFSRIRPGVYSALADCTLSTRTPK